MGPGRLEGHAQLRGSVACESRGQPGASTRQQQASRQDQGLWPRRCTTPGSGLRPRKSTCCRPQPDPVLASRDRRSRPPLCSPGRAGKLSPPAPRESLPSRTPIPRGGGEPGCARAAGRGGQGSGEVAITVHARAAQATERQGSGDCSVGPGGRCEATGAPRRPSNLRDLLC